MNTSKIMLSLRNLAGESFVQFPRQLWSERIDATAKKCVAAGFTMRVVQEAQDGIRGPGIGVAIISDPFCHLTHVLFKKSIALLCLAVRASRAPSQTRG